MLDKIEKDMLNKGIMPEKSVLIGLSGGADSVALTYIMHKLSEKYGFMVYTAHLNHMLRGKDADKDEEFCREFAKNLGITHYEKSVDISKISHKTGDSEEVAGRNARYDFFMEIMENVGIELCATAHHKNDCAETVIMNFLRGSGISGLKGIPYKRDNFIRPLLCVCRDDIEEFCKCEGLSYVTDKTNSETKYTRNKIRNLLIPYLKKEYNPNLVDTITQNAEVIAYDNDYLDLVAEREFKAIDNNAIEISRIEDMHIAIAMRVVRKMIEKITGLTDISARHIKDILSLKDTGKSLCIKDDVVARVEYGKLIIDRYEGDCEDFFYKVKIGESVRIDELGYTVTVERAESINEKGKWISYMTLPDGVNEITIRNRRDGDTFKPKGMNGTKKVKEYMINEKIPRNMRSRTGIVEVDGQIGWIIGHREDARFSFNGNGIKISVSY